MTCDNCQFEEGHSLRCPKYEKSDLFKYLTDKENIRRAAEGANVDQRKLFEET